MALATLTSKGQVTIPKVVRKALGLHTGDRLEFVLTKQGEAFFRPVTKRVDEVFGKLYKPKRDALSIEDMHTAVERRMKRAFK